MEKTKEKTKEKTFKCQKSNCFSESMKELTINKSEIGKILNDNSRPLAERFRALFTLKQLGGKESVDQIAAAFTDDSALLKHELAYCLGQMQDPLAIPVLLTVLSDPNQDTMVRHEAGEALGAIGVSSADVIDRLRHHAKDEKPEIAETCQLALERLDWLQTKNDATEKISSNPYKSVDPAPPSSNTNVSILTKELIDESLPLFKRYRAMFSLRNIGTNDSVLALCKGLDCSSALFRHEIAYVLGQMQHEASIPALTKCLAKDTENPMVRHECAEALGSVAKEECLVVLNDFAKDKERVVKESCEVALDMYNYETSEQFQPMDTVPLAS